jgi:hypothetical protein
MVAKDYALQIVLFVVPWHGGHGFSWQTTFWTNMLPNVIEYLVRAQMFVTKSRNNLLSSCVNTNGVVGLKKFVTLGFFCNHKCCCRPTSCMSYFTSIMSLSPNKYFNKLSNMSHSMCIMSNIFQIGSSYMCEPTSFNWWLNM